MAVTEGSVEADVEVDLGILVYLGGGLWVGIGVCEKRARRRIQKRAGRINSYPVCFWVWGKHDQSCLP